MEKANLLSKLFFWKKKTEEQYVLTVQTPHEEYKTGYFTLKDSPSLLFQYKWNKSRADVNCHNYAIRLTQSGAAFGDIQPVYIPPWYCKQYEKEVAQKILQGETVAYIWEHT